MLKKETNHNSQPVLYSQLLPVLQLITSALLKSPPPSLCSSLFPHSPLSGRCHIGTRSRNYLLQTSCSGACLILSSRGIRDPDKNLVLLITRYESIYFVPIPHPSSIHPPVSIHRMSSSLPGHSLRPIENSRKAQPVCAVRVTLFLVQRVQECNHSN